MESSSISTSSALASAVESFLFTKRTEERTSSTVATYDWWLGRFTKYVGDQHLNHLLVLQFFAELQAKGLGLASRHQAFRTLRTFFKWGLDQAVFTEYYLQGFTLRKPDPLPFVPTEDEVVALVKACLTNYVGWRNKALVLVLADSGLRATEACRLLVAHRDGANRTLRVFGKGRKERVVPFGFTTARTLKTYLGMRGSVAPEDYLFVTEQGTSLKPRQVLQIIHRLSAAAGLSSDRRMFTHALRAFAATNWLRNGMGLDHVRRLLGHKSLATTLVYSRLVAADLKEAHEKAAGIDRLGLD